MTEKDWHSNDEAYPHLNHVREYASIRKLRLVAADFTRWLKTFPEYQHCRPCADVIEETADDPKTIQARELKVWRLPGDHWDLCRVLGPDTRVGEEVSTLVAFARIDFVHGKMIGLVRDIFGNPFRPVTFDPRWRSTDVVGLATAIYEDHAFERMPILADALMDAGCEDEQVIGHCRGDRPHVRGCWVVDSVLGKE